MGIEFEDSSLPAFILSLVHLNPRPLEPIFLDYDLIFLKICDNNLKSFLSREFEKNPWIKKI
jgi:hypothetical protein